MGARADLALPKEAKVWSGSEAVAASTRNTGATLSKEEICRKAAGEFTELARNLEKPGLENRNQDR